MSTTPTPSTCDNCDWIGTPFTTLADIHNLNERLDPGGMVPSGECPKCGALCYPIEQVRPHGTAGRPAGPHAADVNECAAIAAAEYFFWLHAKSTCEADAAGSMSGTAAAVNILCAIHGLRAPWHPNPTPETQSRAELENLRNELESRRVDGAQLQRMVQAINRAVPDFKTVMGSECEQAELALHELIRREAAARNLSSKIQ